ncbi:MAG TPA: flavodoxin domain-containing protein [Gemmatimonadales bacterium]|nr:flavodoxin domain-containing protein [Gemmatimonadales bacterium]
MSRILVLYGTTDGHTAKVAHFLETELHRAGLAVDVVAAGDGPLDPYPDNYAAVIVAASVHFQGYQRAVRRWLRQHAEALNARPSAFVSVCLGVLEQRPEVDRELHRIMESLFIETEWWPRLTQVVAGALPFRRYGWLKRVVMRRIARKAGVDADSSQDREFTDWDDVGAFVGRFIELVQGRSKRPSAIGMSTAALSKTSF